MSLRELVLNTEYRSSIALTSRDFYAPILKVASKYDRAVGFFSSLSLVHIAEGLLPFVNNGGTIRLVASPILNQEDVEAIKHGYEKRESVIAGAIMRELYEPKNFRDSERLNLLANLIADGRLDIKIALVENNKNYGIYHEKMGIFFDDEGNKIAFSGSNNETYTGMDINYEAFDVFCSWENEVDAKRADAKADAFEKIWNGLDPKVSTYVLPEVKESILEKYMRAKVDYQLFDEKDFEPTDDLLVVEKENGDDSVYRARVPADVILHPYQEDAIDVWQEKGFHGIFDMATGTGKTYTGLGAIARLSEFLEDKLAVFIVCPYQHLVEQWKEDIVRFGMNPIVGYGAIPAKQWKTKLSDAVRNQKLKVRKREFFCFVTTNATFSGDFVQEQIRKIKGNALLVVDEAHNFGADYLRCLLSDKFSYRLALSATLDRHGDPEGTQALYDYFGDKCIEYTLDRAIAENKLTKYKYYPIIVSLSEDERAAYADYSRQIAKCLIKGKNGKLKLSEKGKKIALIRARLVAGAINKIEALEKVITPYKEDKHILVYCGATKVLDPDKESTEVDDDDLRQIDIVTDLLGNKMKMKVSQFTSNESIEERAILKKEFAAGDTLQALIAIKCLDEGVNIPSIRTAFILASTTNPKEYIQRRGRVLRLADGKDYAEIYDFITLPRPLDEVSSLTEEEMKRELTLVKNELCRAEEFARIAMNCVSCSSVLDDIREAYDLQDYVLEFEGDFDYAD
ncbi:MAG: DEAD/DEAH box helicase family protein [Lachnospiraceae bacterium]|jgi:superfamily II DNA or RNA helicase|nr:DEAD/DEAH box helicase family protein [Lachnospiraceae bacterium]